MLPVSFFLTWKTLPYAPLVGVVGVGGWWSAVVGVELVGEVVNVWCEGSVYLPSTASRLKSLIEIRLVLPPLGGVCECGRVVRRLFDH